MNDSTPAPEWPELLRQVRQILAVERAGHGGFSGGYPDAVPSSKG